MRERLAEAGVSPTEFARQIRVPPNRISQILHGRRSISGDSALRLGHWFGEDAAFWLDLQLRFDLATASRRSGALIRRLPRRRKTSQRRRRSD